ncbi:MAG: hypothetical protein Q7V63_02310 [Gammaproteobacteria bacterium]|nr:hypothetical protein [Gammaproteobacteria bacterium]
MKMLVTLEGIFSNVVQFYGKGPKECLDKHRLGLRLIKNMQEGQNITNVGIDFLAEFEGLFSFNKNIPEI